MNGEGEHAVFATVAHQGPVPLVVLQVPHDGCEPLSLRVEVRGQLADGDQVVPLEDLAAGAELRERRVVLRDGQLDAVAVHAHDVAHMRAVLEGREHAGLGVRAQERVVGRTEELLPRGDGVEEHGTE